ncbi:MAG: alpha/beta fold hydrolase [Bacteroidales bacterium]
MELNFKKVGEGPPVIILHGLYGSSDNWFSFSRDLSDLGYAVYIPDARNHGESSHSEEHSYEAMRDDIKEFMQKQEIEKAYLIGHSMGGKTAISFAMEYPEMLKGLAVIDIAPRSYSEKSRDASALPSHGEILEAMDLLPLSSIRTREEADEVLAGKIKSKRIRQFLLKNLKRKSMDSFEWGLNVKGLKKNLSKIMEGMNQPDNRPSNGISGFPVLFVKGSESPYIREDDYDLIKELFPVAVIETIPGAGHWVHVEKQDELLGVIRRFLKR